LANVQELIPTIAKIIGAVTIILVIADYFVVGGLGTTPWNITTLNAINTRSKPLITIIMVGTLVRLYYGRVRSGDSVLRRKGFIFFVGMALTLAIGGYFGYVSAPYSVLTRVLVQAVTETGSCWIGIVYVAAVVRGYIINSYEGVVMAIPGLIELFALGGIGNLILPQLGDLGIWIVRYPNVGGNIPIAFAANIATISIAARIITGRQKLRAAR